MKQRVCVCGVAWGGRASERSRDNSEWREQTADGCDAAASINIGRNGWKPPVLAEVPTAAAAAMIMRVEVVPCREAGGHRKDIAQCTPAHLGLFMQYK